jgi:hypothetical protein
MEAESLFALRNSISSADGNTPLKSSNKNERCRVAGTFPVLKKIAYVNTSTFGSFGKIFFDRAANRKAFLLCEGSSLLDNEVAAQTAAEKRLRNPSDAGTFPIIKEITRSLSTEFNVLCLYI